MKRWVRRRAGAVRRISTSSSKCLEFGWHTFSGRRGKEVLGTIDLKDIVKQAIWDRFDRFRQWESEP